MQSFSSTCSTSSERVPRPQKRRCIRRPGSILGHCSTKAYLATPSKAPGSASRPYLSAPARTLKNSSRSVPPRQVKKPKPPIPPAPKFGPDTALLRALDLDDEQEFTDLVNCLILAESSYKVVDMGRRGAARMVQRMKLSFPPGAVTVERLQWSLPSVFHRYMMAEDESTIYVAFIGTKQRRDLVTNAAVLQVLLWPDDEPDSTAGPAVHRGFLSRARTIPIEGLYAHACRCQKRLVLTGHSLGGSVAQLSLLRLLKQLPPGADAAVRCVTFACPAVGNPALNHYVKEAGWEHYFQNLLIPEDVVPRLLASPKQSPEQVVASTVEALELDSQLPLPLNGRDGDDSLAVLAVFEDLYELGEPKGDGSPISKQGPTGILPEGLSKGEQGSTGLYPGLVGVWSRRAEGRGWGRLPDATEATIGEEFRKEALDDVGGLDDGDISSDEEDEWRGSEPEGSPSSLDLDEDDEAAELAQLEGAQKVVDAAAKSGSAKAGMQGRRVGGEGLSAGQDIFFPWSSRPIPNFAREMAGRAMRTAGGMKKFRRTKQLSLLPAPASPSSRDPRDNEASGSDSSQDNSAVSTADVEVDNGNSYERSSVSSEDGRDLESGDGLGPAFPSSGSQSRFGQAMSGGRSWGLKNGKAIGRLGVSMSRAATGAARGAARIVSAPIRVAQRSYAPLGRQGFLSSAGIFPADLDEKLQSFEEGLEGASNSRKASPSALSLTSPPGGASPSTIVSLQLPVAAARRRQPFLMHKMAFHRARVLSILERVSAEAESHSQQALATAADSSLLSDKVAPPLQPTRAEVFLPYSLPDDADLKVMLEDLGTLSSLPPMAAAVQQSRNRFGWLKPWRWISGLGWKGSRRRGVVELTAQIRGTGLENCTSVEVQATDGDIWCETAIVYRPSPPPPAEVYAELGLHRPRVLRNGARLAWWAKGVASRVTARVDRTNLMGSADCLLVKIQLPVEVMAAMEARLLQQAGDDSGLVVHLTSDFRKAQVPLQVHGGSSWLITDIRASSQTFNQLVSRTRPGRSQ